MRTLLVVGIGVFVAGLVTAAFGLPVKEFSFGNTLILSGTVTSCTGLIMISLSLVIREVRGAADRLRSEAMAADRAVPDLRGPILPGRSLRDDPPPWGVDQAAPNAGGDPAMTTFAQSPRRQAGVPNRDPVATAEAPEIVVPEIAVAEAAVFADTPAPMQQRRNLLFEKSMRKDRERAMAERPHPAGLFLPGTHIPDPDASRSASADDAWARSERSRLEPGGKPLASPSVIRGDRVPSPHHPDVPAVTVLRSGVVDGMAYSLYSDGTIEAQLAEGMMRFSSVDQLRAHLDRKSGRPLVK